MNNSTRQNVVLKSLKEAAANGEVQLIEAIDTPDGITARCLYKDGTSSFIRTHRCTGYRYFRSVTTLWLYVRDVIACPLVIKKGK